MNENKFLKILVIILTILGYITLTLTVISALTNIFAGCRIYKLRLENYKLEKKIEKQQSVITDLEENGRGID